MKHRKQNRIGKWGSYSFDPTSISPDGMQEAIANILQEYGDAVFIATEDALTAGAYALKDELRDATPNIKNPPKGYTKKNFGKRWKVVGEGKYRLKRYVGNSTVVSSKEGDPVSLTNIFEYSTTRGHPFVKNTVENSADKVAAAMVAAVKKGV